MTLLNYYEEKKPELSNFVNGKFFGTRFGYWEDLTCAVNVGMIGCKYVEANNKIEKVGSLKLI